ncbi:hypothetical protein K2P96_00880, partial [Patescibacteria group bacterium]|nr:hypothetical protein [Patescibacteria group bacterium]
MAKTFKVLQIIPTTSTSSGKIVIEGDYTAAFTGSFYLDEATNTHYPFYEDQPEGTRQIDATSFKLVDNPRFAGRYSIRTPRANALGELDRFLDEDGNTVLQVNELIKPLGETEDTTPLSYGTITNIATFIIETPDDTIY